MSTYLLDTNAISAIVEKDPRVDGWLSRRTADDDFVVCTIVLGEILFGLERMVPGRRRDDLAMQLREVLLRFKCEAIPEAAAPFYASVKHIRRTRGLPLDENDLWIAATALALPATLVTHDTDFIGVPRLDLQDWSI